MSVPLERHLADFLKANPGREFMPYRRRCLELWEKTYGPEVAAKVKAIHASEYKAEKAKK